MADFTKTYDIVDSPGSQTAKQAVLYNEANLDDLISDYNTKIGDIADVKDEDDMASDSATSLATQQSIKAYADSTKTKSVQNLLRNPMAVMSNGTLANHPDESSILTGTDSDFSGAGNWIDAAGWSVTAGVHRVTATTNNTYIDLSGFTIGRIYKYSTYFPAYTSGEMAIRIQASGGGANLYDSGTFTPSALSTHTLTFKATATSHRILIACGTTSNFDMDNNTVIEQVPACIAADALAYDLWLKESTMDIYRIHARDAFTLSTEVYATKTVPSAQNDRFWFGWSGGVPPIDWLEKVRGSTITIQAKVISDTANDIALFIYNNDYVYSAYHTGSGTEETLELTVNVDNDITQFLFGIRHLNASPGNAYITDMQISLAAEIGEGNYQPPPPHYVNFETLYQSSILYADNFSSSADYIDIDAEVDSECRIPITASSARMFMRARDSGSGANRAEIRVTGIDGSSDYAAWLSCWGIINDAFASITADIPLDSGGFQYYIVASGAGTFDSYIHYRGCLLK